MTCNGVQQTTHDQESKQDSKFIFRSIQAKRSNPDRDHADLVDAVGHQSEKLDLVALCCIDKQIRRISVDPDELFAESQALFLQVNTWLLLVPAKTHTSFRKKQKVWTRAPGRGVQARFPISASVNDTKSNIERITVPQNKMKEFSMSPLPSGLSRVRTFSSIFSHRYVASAVNSFS